MINMSLIPQIHDKASFFSKKNLSLINLSQQLKHKLLWDEHSLYKETYLPICSIQYLAINYL